MEVLDKKKIILTPNFCNGTAFYFKWTNILTQIIYIFFYFIILPRFIIVSFWTLIKSYTVLYNVQDRIESHMDRNGFKLVGLIIINKIINAV